jgi:hypothetical protein
LITVVILGLAGVALLGGMGTGVRASDLHHQQADGERLLANLGETVVSQNRTQYVSCATSDPPGYTITVPTGWTTMVAYQYWDWHSSTFSSICHDDGTHKSVQLITIKVFSPRNQVEMERSFVKGIL